MPQPVVVLRGYGTNLQTRKEPQQRRRAFFQNGSANIDRNVTHFARAWPQRLQQQTRLDSTAAAELDDRHLPREIGGNVTGMVAQNRGLGPRQVIFGQRADRLKEARSFGVVEITA